MIVEDEILVAMTLRDECGAAIRMRTRRQTG
jgi:hypothetical protein